AAAVVVADGQVIQLRRAAHDVQPVRVGLLDRDVAQDGRAALDADADRQAQVVVVVTRVLDRRVAQARWAGAITQDPDPAPFTRVLGGVDAARQCSRLDLGCGRSCARAYAAGAGSGASARARTLLLSPGPGAGAAAAAGPTRGALLDRLGAEGSPAGCELRD